MHCLFGITCHILLFLEEGISSIRNKFAINHLSDYLHDHYSNLSYILQGWWVKRSC